MINFGIITGHEDKNKVMGRMKTESSLYYMK
jgi:hypothetical protein